jgi:hypothetical protein
MQQSVVIPATFVITAIDAYELPKLIPIIVAGSSCVGELIVEIRGKTSQALAGFGR